MQPKLTVKSPLGHNVDDDTDDLYYDAADISTPDSKSRSSDFFESPGSSPSVATPDTTASSSPEKKPFVLSSSSTVPSGGFKHDVHAKVLSEMQSRGMHLRTISTEDDDA